MSPRKRIAWFVVSVLALYGVFSVPWPGVAEAYSTLYRAVGNQLFGSFGSGGVVRFQPAPKGSGMDTEIAIRNSRSPVVGTTPHNTRITGYLPTVEVVALILATPIPWSRRWKALVWGLVLVHAFVIWRVWLTLLHWFSVDQPWALYHPSPFWSKVLSGLFDYAVVAPTCSFVIPALIWILVSQKGGRLLFLDEHEKGP